MKKTERTYNLSDAVLLRYGNRIAEVIPEDFEAFKTFDTTFPDSYQADLKTSLASVMALKTDMVIVDEMAEKTQAVQEAMAACNSAFRTIKFFVNKAFPGNTAVHNQFGFNDIAKARRNHGTMLLFMGDFTKVTQSYRTALLEAGCSEGLLDSLPQLHQELQEAETAQELFKKERGLLTQQRVEKLNELYKLLTPVSEMAQIIYANDEARRARYSLPSPNASTPSSSNGADEVTDA
ncbi:hypothetical protein [Carboxylicivirga taeanensis]|uniref:hypothetical protein n=1 Tax=Carboxylicivirga taeanensis TaxID=1416875 RepID=UPI003F6DC9F3